MNTCHTAFVRIFCFFDATDVAVLQGELLLTTTCRNLRFDWVHMPQKDLMFWACPLQLNKTQ